jgi:hypothetical protein
MKPKWENHGAFSGLPLKAFEQRGAALKCLRVSAGARPQE